MMTAPDDAPAAKFVPFMSMGSWMLLAIISLYGYVLLNTILLSPADRPPLLDVWLVG